MFAQDPAAAWGDAATATCSEVLDTLAPAAVAAVEDVAGQRGDQVVVDVVVVGEDDDRVGAGELGLVEGHLGERALEARPSQVDVGDVLVDVGDLGAEAKQVAGDDEGGGLTEIGGVRLVGEAEEDDPAPLQRLAPLVQSGDEALDDVVGHVGVHVVRQLDEAEASPERALDVEGQVARVDRQAVPPHSRAGVEAHEPEGLRRRGVEGLPDVDAQLGGEHRQLVDEGDVDVAERVLDELGELGLPRARDGDRLRDEGVVEGLDRLEAAGGDARDELRGLREAVLGIARVDPLGAVAEVVVAPGDEARALPDQAGEELLGRSRVGRRLEDDERARPQVGAERPGGVLDVGEVGPALPEGRGDGDDRDVEAGERPWVRGWPVAARRERRGEGVGGHVLDVGVARPEALDSVLVDVEADDPVACLDRRHGEGEADVTLAQHRDPYLRGRHPLIVVRCGQCVKASRRAGGLDTVLPVTSETTVARRHEPAFIYDSSVRLAPVRGAIADLHRYRALIHLLVARDLTVRYKRSLLGVTWTVLNPLLTSLVMWLVFNHLFHSSIPGNVPFLVYLLAGNLMATYFQQGISMTAASLTASAGMLTKVYVPPVVFALSAACGGAINLLFGLVPLFAFQVSLGPGIAWTATLIPILLVFMLAMIAGIGLFLSTFAIQFDDILQLVTVLLMLFSYLAPIFYPITIIPIRYRRYFYLNPLYSYVEVFRYLSYGGPTPSWLAFAVVGATGVVGITVGIAVFVRRWPKVAVLL